MFVIAEKIFNNCMVNWKKVVQHISKTRRNFEKFNTSQDITVS